MRDDAEEQQALGGIPVVVVRLRDEKWVQGDVVLRFLIPHARRIADATMEEMPQINWGTAVLVPAYRCLCTGCTMTGTQSILLRCPLLLHLWSYERLPIRSAIDRPITVSGAGGGVGV
jgi:hypothetical protein